MFDLIVSGVAGGAKLSPSDFLGLISGVIFAGFIADIIFRRFGIPPTLLLITVGFVLTNFFHLVSPDSVLIVAPYFGAIAFAVILFEAGLILDIYALIRKVTVAFLFSTFIFIVSSLGIAALWIIYGGNAYEGLIIGVILGGTSGAIVIPTIAKLKTSPEAKVISKFEAVLAEVYIVVGVSVILSIIKGGSVNVLQHLYNSFANAIFFGLIAGFIWLQVIKSLIQNEVHYIVTLGMLFGMYWLVETLGGNGPLSAIILGMVMANAQNIVERLLPFFRINRERLDMLNFTMDEFTKQASTELAFVSSTFFFLILGMSVRVDYLLNAKIIGGIIGIFLILVGSRLISVFLLYLVDKDIDFRDALILLFMMPRGLVSAIVAFSVGAAIPDKAQLILSYTFGVIVVSILWMTLGSFAIKMFVKSNRDV